MEDEEWEEAIEETTHKDQQQGAAQPNNAKPGQVPTESHVQPTKKEVVVPELIVHNEEIDDGTWLENVIWDEERVECIKTIPVIIDLNDEEMLFDVTFGSALEETAPDVKNTIKVSISEMEAQPIPGNIIFI